MFVCRYAMLYTGDGAEIKKGFTRKGDSAQGDFAIFVVVHAA